MADKAEANNSGVSTETPMLLPFSLTKHSTIFAEVKGCFGINITINFWWLKLLFDLSPTVVRRTIA